MRAAWRPARVTCWCFSAAIPADVLERIPADLRGRACICAKCAAPDNAPDKGRAKGVVALVIAFLLLAASPQGLVQSGVGTITGVVRDQANGVMPGAVITVTAADAAPRKVTANADGRYRVADLPAGVYRVRAELAGFRPSPAETVTVAGSGTVELHFALRIGFLEIADYVLPAGGARGALQKADVVLHLRITERLGPRVLPPCECTIDTLHRAQIIGVFKNTGPELVTGGTLTFHQDQAGEWVEDGRTYRGQFAPYRTGDELIGLFSRDDAGRLSELAGPHYLSRIANGRVKVPPYFSDAASGMTEDMGLDAFIAALKRLLAS